MVVKDNATVGRNVTLTGIEIIQDDEIVTYRTSEKEKSRPAVKINLTPKRQMDKENTRGERTR